jgi:acetyltransferase-like isoleucine patch superfamily enzyme
MSREPKDSQLSTAQPPLEARHSATEREPLAVAQGRPAVGFRIKDAVGRLIDMPFAIRNGKAIQVAGHAKIRHRSIRLLPGCSVRVGDQSIVLAKVLFDRGGGALTVGDRTFVGASTLVIASRIEIGSDVLIAWGCTLVDHDSHPVRFSDRKDDVVDWYRGVKDWSRVETAPVVVEDRAWIGLNAVILKGVRIGEGSVVAAASVVTKDVPPYVIVAGNPARVVRELGPDER